MPSTYKIIIACCVALSLGLNQSSQADQQAPIPIYLPIESAQLNIDIKQLNRDLQAANLERFRIYKVRSWSAYQHAMKDAQIAVFLAAPHYSAWSVHKSNYVPLLRIKEPLKYVLAVRKSDSHIFELNDLKNKSVCTRKPLNLDYLMISQAFKNSMHGADIISVNSPHHEMLLDSSDCAGFAISAQQFEQLAEQQPDKFIRLHQSVVLNNYSFIAHPEIEQVWLDRLRAFLMREQSKPALAAVLSQYAKLVRLVPVDFENYSDEEYQSLLPYW